MIVNGCKLVAVSGEIIDSDPSIQRAFDEYVSAIGHTPRDTVWYDIEDSVCFGSDMNYLNSPRHETCYLTDREFFIKDPRYGLPYFDIYRGSGYKLNELYVDNDIIVEKNVKTERYRDSTVLIVGAGPSFKMANIQEEEYDHLWICNDGHSTKMPASLFYMSNTSQTLGTSKEYMELNRNTIGCFDINVVRDIGLMKEYQSKFGERMFLFSTRVFTSIGTVPRLINLASHLGASKVKFVGMDGHSKEHFSSGKSFSSFELTLKDIPKGQNYSNQRREYLLFWEYMKKKYPSVEFDNLGKVYEHNVTSRILGFLP